MSQVATAVTDIGLKIFQGIGNNIRANEKADAEKGRAELLAAYQRDTNTTLIFNDWALANQKATQDFYNQKDSGNTTNYLIAGVIVLAGGAIFFIFYNRD